MFIDIPIANRTSFRLADELGWWRKDTLRQRTYLAQAQTLIHPDRAAAYTADHDYPHRGGAWVTLRELWLRQGNPYQQVQLLKAGLLHSLMGSSRNRYSEAYLPPFPVIKEARDQAHVEAGILDSPWSYLHTDVLPLVFDDAGRFIGGGFYCGHDLRDPAAFLLALDRMVGFVLQHWQPVRIRYAASPDEVERLLAAFAVSPEKLEADRLAVEHAARLAQREAEDAIRCQEEEACRNARRAQHPRMDEWPPDASALKQLVWTHPVSTVAKLFGVSDTAVRKLCDRQGVIRPPQGYWLRKSH